MEKDKCKINLPREWSELSYAGEKRVPVGVEPAAGSWPTYYLNYDANKEFTNLEGNPIAFKIRNPNTIDFEGKQLGLVKKVLKCLTEEQITIAEYWNAGPPTKQWTPIIDRLIDTYNISAPRAARVLAAVHAGINDTMVVTWYFKYKWNIARPNQLDQNLATIVCTPKHPSYPSGHAAVAGCAETILSYFFEAEKERLEELAEECAISRLYGGVHYMADNVEGLRLGRNVGKIIVNVLKDQYDSDMSQIDYPIKKNRHAKLAPPPYKQVISFPRNRKCTFKLDLSQDPEAR